MLFNVPQYIDVEDKVAGPFTAKQLLWMAGMGAVLMVFWNIFDTATFFLSAIPVVLVFAALAFYRPYNQPLISFIGHSIFFLFKPKVYSWKRLAEPIKTKKRQDPGAGVAKTFSKKEPENQEN